MALRRDYSLSKDLDIEANEGLVNIITDNNEAYLVPGIYFKHLLKRYMAIYKGSCGEGEGINNIYDLYALYSNVKMTDDDYSYLGEASLIKDLLTAINVYEKDLAYINEELGRIIDGWIGSVNAAMLSPDQKQQDMSYVGQVEQIFNRRLFIYDNKLYLFLLMKGALSEGFPKESSNMDSMFTSLEFPLMTHIPYFADIDKIELANSSVMQVLHNIIVKDSYVPMAMMHDYDNGNVCVRLWKKENGEYVPSFVSVIKSDVILEKISYAGQSTIWPGLIEQALRNIDCINSKEEIAEAILGPELESFGIDYLCNGIATPAKPDIPKWFNDAIDAYIKCLYDTYAAFLSTNSLLVEDNLEYTKLIFGIKELMYVVACCYNQNFDILKPALERLRQLIAEYRQFASEKKLPTEQIVSKRLSVCNTIDEIIVLLDSDSYYHNYPHAYFERFLAERIAKIILNSMHMEITNESLNAKIGEVMSDSIFKSKASKINIHILRHPTAKIAEAILAKMERR